MKKGIITAFLIALSGCSGGGDDSSGPSTDNHGYGWEYDAIGAAGMKLRKDVSLWIIPADQDVVFKEARARTVTLCTGIDAPVPPFVVMVPPGELHNDQRIIPDAVGVYFSNPPLIVIERDEAMEHEVVHYLLDMRDGNPDRDHRDPAWRCAFDV